MCLGQNEQSFPTALLIQVQVRGNFGIIRIHALYARRDSQRQQDGRYQPDRPVPSLRGEKEGGALWLCFNRYAVSAQRTEHTVVHCRQPDTVLFYLSSPILHLQCISDITCPLPLSSCSEPH